MQNANRISLNWLPPNININTQREREIITSNEQFEINQNQISRILIYKNFSRFNKTISHSFLFKMLWATFKN